MRGHSRESLRHGRGQWEKTGGMKRDLDTKMRAGRHKAWIPHIWWKWFTWPIEDREVTPWEYRLQVDEDDLLNALLEDCTPGMEQYRPPRRIIVLEGCRALMFAVLADGIGEALSKRASQAKTEAIGWLYGPRNGYIFSFSSCCEALGLGAMSVRLGVNHLEGSARSMNLLRAVRLKETNKWKMG